MGNILFLIHLLVLCDVNRSTCKQIFKNAACIIPVNIGDGSEKLYICTFQHLLESVEFVGSLSNKAFMIMDKFPQFTLAFGI